MKRLLALATVVGAVTLFAGCDDKKTSPPATGTGSATPAGAPAPPPVPPPPPPPPG